MRAELRGLDSADTPDGIDVFQPGEPRKFIVSVAASIGVHGEEGEDTFYFDVVGPDWFAQAHPAKGFRWGRGYLVVDAWNVDVVRRAISDLCRFTEGASWQEIATKIARYGRWEFDDYREA